MIQPDYQRRYARRMFKYIGRPIRVRFIRSPRIERKVRLRRD